LNKGVIYTVKHGTHFPPIFGGKENAFRNVNPCAVAFPELKSLFVASVY